MPDVLENNVITSSYFQKYGVFKSFSIYICLTVKYFYVYVRNPYEVFIKFKMTQTDARVYGQHTLVNRQLRRTYTAKHE